MIQNGTQHGVRTMRIVVVIVVVQLGNEMQQLVALPGRAYLPAFNGSNHLLVNIVTICSLRLGRERLALDLLRPGELCAGLSFLVPLFMRRSVIIERLHLAKTTDIPRKCKVPGLVWSRATTAAPAPPLDHKNHTEARHVGDAAL